jgi:hypothetical protein
MSDVIDLGEVRFRFRRQGYVPPKDECLHRNKTIVERGNYIECDDCGKQLDPMWVVEQLVGYWGDWKSGLEVREKQLQEMTSKHVSLLAAQRVEKAWRSRTMVPMCPHCERGILPEDRLGSSSVNREMEMRRRTVDKARRTQTKEPSQS